MQSQCIAQLLSLAIQFQLHCLYNSIALHNYAYHQQFHIAFLTTSILVQCIKAMHSDCIAYDKHTCEMQLKYKSNALWNSIADDKNSYAMYWDCIVYDKQSCAMYWDCIAYDRISSAMQ